MFRLKAVTHPPVLLCRRDDMPDSRLLDDAKAPETRRYHRSMSEILSTAPQPALMTTSFQPFQTVYLFFVVLPTFSSSGLPLFSWFLK